MLRTVSGHGLRHWNGSDNRLGHWIAKILAIVAAILFLLATSGAARSADDSSVIDSGKVGAYLQSGEFAPALKLAREMSGSAADRDQAFARIARAQAAAGDAKGAIQTVANISNDRLLSDTLVYVKPQSAAEGLSSVGVVGVNSTRAADVSGSGSGMMARLGGAQADFDSLIDLITATVEPTSWDTTGGNGSIMPFPTGVLVDAQGVLKPGIKEDRTDGLARLRQIAARGLNENDDVHPIAGLRKVSLTRLEREVEFLAAQGLPPAVDMQTMAGLERIQYVLVYPEQGEIVLAGPADDVRLNGEGRLVGKRTGRPALRLDDFVVVLRHMFTEADAKFGCSITPTQASLADLKAFVAESSKSPLKTGQRDGWLKQLREKLGRQDIEYYGIDPRTRVGLVLVEADYRMKLVGMGLEEGVPGVRSYLDSIEVAPGQAPPPMDVLRWWFTLNYDAVTTTPQHDAYELHGQGVQVLSENEMLAANGQQIHTGNSDALNQEFAHTFTKHFADLAIKYPIYAELQNVCDLALVAALLHSENLPERVRWHMLYFGEPDGFQVPLAAAPKTVDTVMNYRIVNQTNIIVGVSGGVRIDPTSIVKPGTLKSDNYGALEAERIGASPKKGEPRRWWWD